MHTVPLSRLISRLMLSLAALPKQGASSPSLFPLTKLKVQFILLSTNKIIRRKHIDFEPDEII